MLGSKFRDFLMEQLRTNRQFDEDLLTSQIEYVPSTSTEKKLAANPGHASSPIIAPLNLQNISIHANFLVILTLKFNFLTCLASIIETGGNYFKDN